MSRYPQKNRMRNEELCRETPPNLPPWEVCCTSQQFDQYNVILIPPNGISFSTGFLFFEEKGAKELMLHLIATFLKQSFYNYPNGSPMQNTANNRKRCGDDFMWVTADDYAGLEIQVDFVPDQGPEEMDGHDIGFDDSASQASGGKNSKGGKGKKQQKWICSYIFKRRVNTGHTFYESHVEKVWVVFELLFKQIPKPTDSLVHAFGRDNIAGILCCIFTQDPNYSFQLAMKHQVESNMSQFTQGVKVSDKMVDMARYSSVGTKSNRLGVTVDQVLSTSDGNALGTEVENQKTAFRTLSLLTRNFFIEYVQLLGINPMDEFHGEINDLKTTAKNNPVLANVLYGYAHYTNPKGNYKYTPMPMNDSGCLAYYNMDRVLKNWNFVRRALSKLGADPAYQTHEFVRPLQDDPNNMRYEFRSKNSFASFLVPGSAFLRTEYPHAKTLRLLSKSRIALVQDIYQLNGVDVIASMNSGFQDTEQYLKGIATNNYQPFEITAHENSLQVSACLSAFLKMKTYDDLRFATTRFSELHQTLFRQYLALAVDMRTCETIRNSIAYINKKNRKGEMQPVLRLKPAYENLDPVSQWLAELSMLLNLFTKAVDTNHYIYEFLIQLYNLLMNSHAMRSGNIGIHKILNGGPGTGKSWAEIFLEMVAIPGSILKIDALSNKAVQSFKNSDFKMIFFPDASKYFVFGPDKNVAVDPNSSNSREGIQSLLTECAVHVSRAVATDAGVQTVNTTVLFRANIAMNTNYIVPLNSTESDPFHTRFIHQSTALNSLQPNHSRRTEKNAIHQSEEDKANTKQVLDSLTAYQVLCNLYISFNLEFGFSQRPSRLRVEAFLQRLCDNGLLSMTSRSKEMQLNTADTLAMIGAFKDLWTSSASPFNWVTRSRDAQGNVQVVDYYSTFHMEQLLYVGPYMALNLGAPQAALGGFATDYSTTLKVAKWIGAGCGFLAWNIRQWVHSADRIKRMVCPAAKSLPELKQALQEANGINDFHLVFCCSQEKPLIAKTWEECHVELLPETQFVIPVEYNDPMGTSQCNSLRLATKLTNQFKQMSTALTKIIVFFKQASEKFGEDGESSTGESLRASKRAKTSHGKDESDAEWPGDFVDRLNAAEAFMRSSQSDGLTKEFWRSPFVNKAVGRNVKYQEAYLDLTNKIRDTIRDKECTFANATACNQTIQTLLLIFAALKEYVSKKGSMMIGDAEYKADGRLERGTDKARIPQNFSLDPRKRESKKSDKIRKGRPKDFVSPYLEGIGERYAEKFNSNNKGKERNIQYEANGSPIYNYSDDEENQQEQQQQQVLSTDPLTDLLLKAFPYGAPWTGYAKDIDLLAHESVPGFIGRGAEPLKIPFYEPEEGILDLKYIVVSAKRLEVLLIDLLKRANPESSPLLPTEMSNIIDFGTKHHIYGPFLPKIDHAELTPYALGCFFHPYHLMLCKSVYMPLFKKVPVEKHKNGSAATSTVNNNIPDGPSSQGDNNGGPNAPASITGNQTSTSTTDYMLLMSTVFMMYSQQDMLYILMKMMAPPVSQKQEHIIPLPSLQNLAVFAQSSIPDGMPAKSIHNMKYVDPEVQSAFKSKNSGLVFTEEHKQETIDQTAHQNEEKMFSARYLKQMGFPPNAIDQEDLQYINAKFKELDDSIGEKTFKHPESIVSSLKAYIRVVYN